MCALEERTGAYSYQQRVQKLEHLLVHSRSPGRYPGGSTRSMEDGNAVSAMDAIGGGDSPILESPPAALSNVHDLFFHVAAREEALHSLVQTGKTAYSCERRRRADERDLLIDADRSETLKKAKSRNPHGLQAGLMTAPPAQGVAGQGALQGTMSSIGPGFTITNHSFGNMSSSCRQGASTPDTTRATTTGLFGAASMLATGTASSSPLFGGPVTSATSAASTSGSLFLSTAAAASGGHLFSTPSGCTTGALFGMSTFGTGTTSQQAGSSISFLSQMINTGLAPQPSFLPLVMSQPGLHNIRSVGPGATMMASMIPPMPMGPVEPNFMKVPGAKKKKRKAKHNGEIELDTMGARCDNGLSWFQHAGFDGVDTHGDQWDEAANCETHQKLMRLVSERHDGSLERFVNANVTSTAQMTEKSSKRVMPKRPALTKWKRIKFDQLKGNDAQELAMAFNSLAEKTPGVELTRSLLETSWEDLTIPQLEKMLEETKKLLSVNEKVHDCLEPGCGRRFATPGNLRDHMNEHSGEKPYKCTTDGCGARFPSKQLLCRHMKKHERAHVCTFEGCGKRFAFKERLVVHQKIHSDERPLTCPWEGCGKTFKWPNSLHGHMRTHTGEKPFKCMYPGCGRLFGYKVDLTRHNRTHNGQPARLSH